jgi:predicted Zn-dependent peptidase
MHTARYEVPLNGYRPFPQYEVPVPPPAPAPVPRVRTGMATLVVLASLLLVSAGVFVTLFLTASADHESAVGRLDQQQSELANVKEQVVSAEAERKRADERNKGLKSDNTDLSGCVEAMRHYLWDGLVDSARTAAARVVLAKCQ